MLFKSILQKGTTLVFAATMLLVWGCNENSTPSTKIGKLSIPNILPKDTVSGSREEQYMIRTTFEKGIEKLKANNDNPQPLLDLASAYILEGRISGNGGYYSIAALKVISDVLDAETATQDQRFQALSLKSAVLLNMHQFKGAYDAANEGLAISQYNAGIWGALVDANVELGKYDDAVKASDRMMGLRPDLRSYSRVSYLRQIYGQNAGAIEAMKMAVESGVPGAEATEWARVQLADLYLNNGNPDSARLLYRYSLVYRPAYPFAEMGLARADRAQKQYASAIEHARAAIKVQSEPAFIAYLGELYELAGDAAKAKKVRDDVKRLLVEARDAEPKDALVKHNSARELAAAHLAAGELDEAVNAAKEDYDMRPDNIDAAELMAWITYRKGDVAAAKSFAEKTLITGIKSASTLYKAGVIFAAAGDAARGNALQAEAMRINPFLETQAYAAAK